MMKIGDFGMSKQLQGGGPGNPQGSTRRLERTLTPGTIGTAAYCAPEVCTMPLSAGLTSLACGPVSRSRAQGWSGGVA